MHPTMVEYLIAAREADIRRAARPAPTVRGRRGSGRTAASHRGWHVRQLVAHS